MNDDPPNLLPHPRAMPRPANGLGSDRHVALQRLVDAARRGDPDAERTLFRRYHRLVCHVLQQRGHPPETVDDLAQETFVRAFRGLSGYRGEARFDRWLLHIAENVHRETLRRASAARRDAVEVALDPAPGSDGDAVRTVEPPTSAADPLRRLLGREDARAVAVAVRELPAQMRQCMLLRFDQELSYREIAAVLQISVDAVKVQIHRGRRRLREHLADRTVHAAEGAGKDLVGAGAAR